MALSAFADGLNGQWLALSAFADGFNGWLLALSAFADGFNGWLLALSAFADGLNGWLLALSAFADGFNGWLLELSAFADGLNGWLLELSAFADGLNGWLLALSAFADGLNGWLLALSAFADGFATHSLASIRTWGGLQTVVACVRTFAGDSGASPHVTKIFFMLPVFCNGSGHARNPMAVAGCPFRMVSEQHLAAGAVAAHYIHALCSMPPCMRMLSGMAGVCRPEVLMACRLNSFQTAAAW